MKRFAIVCLVLACAAALGAQTEASKVGVKAGFSLARIHETATVPLLFEWQNLPFVTGGVFVEGGWGLMALEAEALYVQMGGRFTIDEANGLKNRFHYIQVPVQVKVRPVGGGLIRPFVAGGAYGAYLIRAESYLTADGETAKANVTADYVRWDVGVLGSAGLTFKLPGMSLSLEGRYNLGLMNILRDPIAGDTIHNRCWMALVGLSY